MEQQEAEGGKTGPGKGSGAAGPGRGKKVLVPKFLTRTYDLVSDPKNKEYAGWNSDGTVIEMRNLHGLAEKVLPQYFNHSNYSSFVRQLNMYGFVRAEQDQQWFKNPNFIRGQPEKLGNIKRKPSTAKTAVRNADIIDSQKKEIDKLMEEVASLKEKHTKFEDEVVDLKAKNLHLDSENIHLWEAITEAKHRHKNLQNKMKKVVLFLQHIYENQAKLDPSIAKSLPEVLKNVDEASRIADGAPDLNKIKEAGTTADLLTKPPSNDNNDLQRLPTLGQLPTLTGEDLLAAEKGSQMDGSSNEIARSSSSSSQMVPYVVDKSPPSVKLEPLPAEDYSADPLQRGASLQSFMDMMEQKDKEEKFGKYSSFANNLSEYVTDQDNVFKRLNSLSESVSADPIPTFDQDENDTDLHDLVEYDPEQVGTKRSSTTSSPGSEQPDAKKLKSV